MKTNKYVILVFLPLLITVSILFVITTKSKTTTPKPASRASPRLQLQGSALVSQSPQPNWCKLRDAFISNYSSVIDVSMITSPANMMRYESVSEAFRIACYPPPHDIVCTAISKHGMWETKILNDMKHFREKIMGVLGVKEVTYVDIGAHVGSYGFPMASSGSPTILIEAMPSNVALLYTTLCGNDPGMVQSWDLTLYHVALQEDKWRLDCKVSSFQGNVGNGMITCKGGSSVATTVPASTLDDVFPNGFPYPCIVKIDVEGNEGGVFRGGADVVFATANRKRLPIVIVTEVWKQSSFYEDYGMWLIEELGYVCMWLEQRMEIRSAADVAHMKARMENVQNLIFVQREYSEVLIGNFKGLHAQQQLVHGRKR
eukprot:PhF_6_TR30566/c1_g1_i1/m.44910